MILCIFIIFIVFSSGRSVLLKEKFLVIFHKFLEVTYVCASLLLLVFDDILHVL